EEGRVPRCQKHVRDQHLFQQRGWNERRKSNKVRSTYPRIDLVRARYVRSAFDRADGTRVNLSRELGGVWSRGGSLAAISRRGLQGSTQPNGRWNRRALGRNALLDRSGSQPHARTGFHLLVGAAQMKYGNSALTQGFCPRHTCV